MKQKLKYERHNENRGNKPWTKINQKTQEKIPEVTVLFLHCYTSKTRFTAQCPLLDVPHA